jgi:hypothetical protein
MGFRATKPRPQCAPQHNTRNHGTMPSRCTFGVRARPQHLAEVAAAGRDSVDGHRSPSCNEKSTEFMLKVSY